MNRFTGIDYSKLQQHNEECDSRESDAFLLREIARELSESTKKRIAKNLERYRAHFSNSKVPGAMVWYPSRLAACARFDELIGGSTPERQQTSNQSDEALSINGNSERGSEE